LIRIGAHNISNYALTGIFGLGNDFGEQFSEVGQVFPQEFSFEDEGLAGVICEQLTSKKLRLPYNSQTGASLGILKQAQLDGDALSTN
jgi:hypothetical protein